jgi:hypothetical protein
MSVRESVKMDKSHLWLVLDSNSEGSLPEPILEALHRFEEIPGIWQKAIKELAG